MQTPTTLPDRTRCVTFGPLREGHSCVIDRCMTARRSLLTLLILAVFIVGGALVGYVYVSAPKDTALPWNLTGMGGVNSNSGQHHPFDATQAGTMTTLEVHVEQWPVDEPKADEWLTQTIDYGSDSVTITLRLRGTKGPGSTGLPTIGYYDTGGWVTVALREPLRSRNLVDGASGKVVPYPSAP